MNVWRKQRKRRWCCVQSAYRQGAEQGDDIGSRFAHLVCPLKHALRAAWKRSLGHGLLEGLLPHDLF